MFVSKTDSEPCTVQVPAPEMRNVAPVIAVFDGMPIQNHPLLRNRIIVDDQMSMQSNTKANTAFMVHL